MRALCVGIDEYLNKEDRLSGCKNDAKSWERALKDVDVDTSVLLNANATSDAILTKLELLVRQAKAGDGELVIFHFSGHGIRFYDDDSNEPVDEALCPLDFEKHLIRESDFDPVFSRLDEGVSLICFLDACFSKGVVENPAIYTSVHTRKLKSFVYQPGAEREADNNNRIANLPRARPRTLMREIQHASGTVALPSTSMKNVIVFSACDDDQFAWEYGEPESGEIHGLFSRHAAKFIGDALRNQRSARFLLRRIQKSMKDDIGGMSQASHHQKPNLFMPQSFTF